MWAHHVVTSAELDVGEGQLVVGLETVRVEEDEAVGMIDQAHPVSLVDLSLVEEEGAPCWGEDLADVLKLV